MEIEIARAKLYKSIDDYGLQHINTIELSMKLDKLIEKAIKEKGCANSQELNKNIHLDYIEK
jgi:hypothetical protein